MILPEVTEREFDRFFELLNYRRVQEDVGESPSFQNADFVHKEDRTIIELKVLFKEHFGDGGVIAPLNALILQPVSINAQGAGQYTFSVPDPTRVSTRDCFVEAIRRTLKKANKQLRDTRSFYFGDSSANGYVFLAQTGLESLSPEVVALVARNIVWREFSEINGVVVCTPHFRTRDPITLRHNPECVSVTNEKNLPRKRQCIRLADAWIEHFDKGGFSRA